jgi:HEPN domain-containing protein
MKSHEESLLWLKRAKSNLLRAKTPRTNEEIYYEDYCYDAQQCAEKALKAYCIFLNLPYPKTHDINYLFELIENAGVEISEENRQASILSEYSVETRYPGDYIEVTEEDYKKAIFIAEQIYKWVLKELDSNLFSNNK